VRGQEQKSKGWKHRGQRRDGKTIREGWAEKKGIYIHI